MRPSVGSGFAIACAVALTWALPCSGQQALTVEVQLERPVLSGLLRVAVCPNEEAFENDLGCVTASAQVVGSITEVRLSDVPEGLAAVKVFHDRDADGRLRTNWIGWPLEPFGFSNDPPIRFGPPSFRAAAVALHRGENTVRVTLR